MRVVEGPDLDKTVRIGATPMRFGRSSSCHLRLNDRETSGQHCEVWLEGGELRVRDLGSRNGSVIGGARVQEGAWPADQELRVGNNVLRWWPAAAERAGGESAILGDSSGIALLRQQIGRVAGSDTTVLIEGETGTGKELVAEEIHRLSKRAAGPLVVVDCGSIPANLIESELFGHERGAFTGATGPRRGAFEEAAGGTLFLDELGELPLALQPAFLRALENRTAKRIGASKPYALDVRVVAATNRDLSKAVSEGAFRADLYFRIAVVHLKVPALRDRVSDIPLLARHFLTSLGEESAVDEEFFEYLQDRPWPGNVRELRNVVERAIRLGDGRRLYYTRTGTTQSQASPRLPPPPPATKEDEIRPYREAREDALDDFLRGYAVRLFAASGGKVARAAELAGVDASYVRRWFRKHCARALPQPEGGLEPGPEAEDDAE